MGVLVALHSSSFNPWYVGGGVKSLDISHQSWRNLHVSILGMLEGVLKDHKISEWGFKTKPFQSLVCWRGC